MVIATCCPRSTDRRTRGDPATYSWLRIDGPLADLVPPDADAREWLESTLMEAREHRRRCVVRAEWIRTAQLGLGGRVLAPAAVLTPLAIKRRHRGGGRGVRASRVSFRPLQVPTSNAGYWVITITLTLVAIAAADGQSSENRYRTAEYASGLAIRSRWSVPVGRWLFYGLLGAGTGGRHDGHRPAALPVVSTRVYGTVSVADPVGLRLCGPPPCWGSSPPAPESVWVRWCAHHWVLVPSSLRGRTWSRQPLGYLPGGLPQRLAPALNGGMQRVGTPC